jgi:uncharacterized protein with PIN domain
MEAVRFIVDHNVGKLAKWLRMMGYDSLFFKGCDDSGIIAIALSEERIILTRDKGIAERRLIKNGRVTAVLLNSDKPLLQMRQVIDKLNLKINFKPFSICLECNRVLKEKSREQVKERVPSYVLKTQNQYVECPKCQRIYWKGTHWYAMKKKLAVFFED